MNNLRPKFAATILAALFVGSFSLSVTARDLVSSVSRVAIPEEPVATAAMGPSPTFDGKLDDPIWQTAPRLPLALGYPEPVKVESEAYWQIAADDQAIYLAVSVPQTKPQFAKPTGQDQWEGDLVEFHLDIDGTDKVFQWCFSPIGLRYDQRGGKKEWQGSWEAKGEVTPKGWTIEFRQPFKELDIASPPRGKTWRMNLCLINGGVYQQWTGKWSDPSGFGPLFFGTRQEYVAATCNQLQLNPSRLSVSQHDAKAVLRVESRFGNAELDAARLRVSLVTADGKNPSQTIPVPKGAGSALGLELDTSQLTVGDHPVIAELLDNERVIASGRGTLARWEDHRRTLAEVKGPLALKQTQPSLATLDSWPFVTGVPLPRGQVADATQARLLDGKGQAVPAQFEALAHWSPKRDSIKWLRVAFTAPSTADKAPRYELQFGPNVQAPKVAAPIQVADGVSEVTVDIGAITLRISKTRVGVFSEVARKKKGVGASAAVYKAAPDDGPYVIDHAGAVFRASLDDAPEVTVEETGPVRAVVRVEAWHVRDPSSGSKGVSSVGVLMDKEAGPPAEQERLNKSVLRYYAYAGQPWVQLDWTFIVTTDTDAVRFKDIGLRMTGSGSARIGLDGDQEAALADGYLLQKKADSYVVRQKQGQSYAETSRGSKAPGWIANDSFSLTMRDFWQMFPKELETKSEIRNLQSQIILHAWPGHGEWNPDWFAEPTTAPATDAVPQEIVGATGVKLTPAYLQWLQRWHHGELLDFHYPDWWRQANIAGTKEKECWLDKIYPHGNRHWEFFSLWSADSIPGGKVKEHALGASRTQQALLDFSGDKAATMAARRSMFLSQPHVWLENPKWLEETQVLGPVHVAAAQAWDQPALDGWQHLDKINYYGMWLYGNMPEYFEPDGSPLIYRQINGSPHYGFFNTGWLLYLATGNPAQLKFAQANAHHWRDISIVHYTTPEFSQHRADRSSKVLGAAQAVGLYPFRLGSVFDFYSGTFHLLMDYYLTGDRRSLEVAKLHTENLMKKRGGTGFTREAGGNQKTMLDWYAHSWDPVVAEWIDNGILSITTGDPTTEKSKSGTKLNWTNFMPQYLDLTSQPDIPLKHRKELLAYVEEWCKEFLGADNFKVGHPGQPGNMLAAAWFATGDVKYLYPFMRGAFRAELPREQWLVPTKPDKGCGPGGAVYFDEMLYSYAAWRDAVEKKLIPVSEADLPVSPPPIKSYRCPVWEAYKGKEVTFVFLKPAGEELRVNVGTYSPGGLLTFTGPDGKIVLQTKTEKGEFKPQLLVVSAKTPAGVYRLHINTEPHKFWATIQTTNQHMVECPKAVALFADAEWMFHVPSHVERFTVRMTTGTKLVDPAFKTVAVGKALYNGQVGEPMVIEAKPEHRGKLWRFRAVHMSGGDLVQIEGVPGYLAAHPSWWFPPPGR